MSDTDPVVRPFAAVLQELNRGRTARELSEELAQLVSAVQETGKAGTLTLTLSLKPSKMTGALELTDKVSVKVPAFDRSASLFFAAADGSLTRDDPSQLKIQFENELAAKRDRDAREAAAGE